MLAGKNEILNYIPQRPPMVMIDSLVAASDTHAVTQFQPMESNVFVVNGSLTEPGLVENIAQTAAAQVGYVCKQRSVPVPVGFIAAIKNLSIYALPKIGEQIETRIEVKDTVMNIVLLTGTSFSGDQKLCECEMKVFINQS